MSTHAAAVKPRPDNHQASPPGQADIDRFLANPSDYFDHSLTKMMGLSREHLDWLQMTGLKRRFGQLRGKLPMMDRLADVQGIEAIDRIEDVLPLLFDHATYKSYPASLLDKHRYPQLTAWLNKLTTLDLSKVDVSACRSIDDWMLTLKRETPLTVAHTSGTSGTMSFLPWSKHEYRKFVGQYPVTFFQRFGEDSPAPKLPLNIDCIYPFFRSGGLAHSLLNDTLVELIAGGEERFHAAYPGRLSADLSLLAARRRAAAAKGQLDQLEIDPDLAARHAEFETQQREMPRRAAEFFDTMRVQLAGRRIFMVAAPTLLLPLAQNGLKQGMRKLFAPNSVVVSGGGGKGIVLPDDWKKQVEEFIGVDRIIGLYGMSEMAGSFNMCGHSHYHSIPWVIPFILDPDSGKPLPRTGTATGRFAFYDLMTETRWGGFVTGDEVTMVWDTPCPCGQTTPYLEAKVQRVSEKRDDAGEEKLSCAAAPEAYAEALDFLNDGAV